MILDRWAAYVNIEHIDDGVYIYMTKGILFILILKKLILNRKHLDEGKGEKTPLSMEQVKNFFPV